MSKKKKKGAPARKVATRTRAASRSARRAGTSQRSAAATAIENNRTFGATIFLYRTGADLRLRTAPQRLTAGPGYVEWTVVNLASGDAVNGEITWPKGSPWGGDRSIPIRDGHARVSLEGAANGRFKYSIMANGASEDPEVEIPWN